MGRQLALSLDGWFSRIFSKMLVTGDTNKIPAARNSLDSEKGWPRDKHSQKNNIHVRFLPGEMGAPGKGDCLSWRISSWQSQASGLRAQGRHVFGRRRRTEKSREGSGTVWPQALG